MQNTLNASTKWGGSTSTFVVTIPGGADNILKIDVSNTDGTRIDESFNVVAENDLRRQGFYGTWKAYNGVDYDILNPLSANQLLGNMRGSDDHVIYVENTQTLGVCDPDLAIHSIYLHCPQISGLDCRGPAPGSSSCIGVLHVTGIYGQAISNNVNTNLFTINAPATILSYLVFSLRNAANKELDMRGSRLSLVIHVEEK